MKRFEGRTAVVTGASRGIGRAIALRLAQEGADIGINFRETATLAEGLAEEVRAMGQKAVLLPADIQDDSAVRAMVTRAHQELGRLDIWVNNAAVEHEQPLAKIEESLWDDTFAINVKGLFFCCRAAGELMVDEATKNNSTGVIINIASRFGLLGDFTSIPYGASKAAVINITKALAKGLAPHVRVNVVAPAFTPTDMTSHLGEEYLAKFHAATPLQRLTRPEDTAAAVAFLASDDAGFTTGAVLPVDGGYTLK